MIAARLRGLRGAQWLAFFGLVALAWLLLFQSAVPPELRAAGRIYGSEIWASLCVATPDLAGYARISAMWILMSGAMMAPTALPALATYADLPERHGAGFAGLVGGYLMVWIGFSLLAAGLQIMLVAAELLSPFGDSRSRLLSAGFLALAGLYQFSPLKSSCLSACRSPLMLFMGHWDRGAVQIGLRLGLACLGCCWALMLLAFVGGVMNLAFMALAMALMFVEKLPDLGRYVTRPLGIGLLGAAVSLAVSGL